MKLKEGLTVRKIGDDYVIVAPEQGMIDLSKVYSLNETAAWLWNKLYDSDFEVSDMVALVREHYNLEDLNDIQLLADMQNLALFFKDNGLLIAE